VLLLDWSGELAGGEVPDPYYGSDADFESVYRLLQSTSARLLERLSG
jgi:protein-tyrosine phosphatase